MNKFQVVVFSLFTFVAGCTAFGLPPEGMPASDGGVAPVADSGSPAPAVDAGPAPMADAGMPAPGTDAGVAPAPADFHCVDGFVGDAIRIHPEDVTGVRTVGAVESPSGSAVASHDMVRPGVILWGLNYGHPLAVPADRDAAGEMHTGSAGAPYEYGLDGTTGGGINTMLFVGGDASVTFEWSDLRPFNGHAAADIGYWVEARQGSTWVRLPDRFVQVAPDTVGMRWSDARELDPALRNTVAIRVVIFTSGTALCGS